MRIVSVGEILWDVFPDAEHLGGAAFNFAAQGARLGHEVYFVSAVGEDERGRRALAKAAELGLSCRFIDVAPGQPTGTVSVSVDSAGQPAFVIHRPAAYDFAVPDIAALAGLQPDWLYFGTLFQMSDRSNRLTLKLVEAMPAARRFYDVNLRKDSYTLPLVEEFLSLASVVKLNDAEMDVLGRALGFPTDTFQNFFAAARRRFPWNAACVTRGANGCAVMAGDDYVEAPGYAVKVADTVGSGDAFAAAFVHGLGSGWPAAKVADFANRVGALVASRAGGTPHWTVDEALALQRA